MNSSSIIDVSDSTVVLDESVTPQRKKTRGGEKLGDTIDLDSSTEDGQRTEMTQHEAFVTASTTQVLDTPKVTSTPNDSILGNGKSKAVTNSASKKPQLQPFHEVEDEFLHDGSFAEEVTKTATPAQDKSSNDPDADSAIFSSHDNKPTSKER